MLVSDFDFDLPDALIAQEPPAERGGSRLLVLNRDTGAIAHRKFSALPEFLRAGDLLVLNNTRVFPARLLGHRVPSGGAVECLLLAPAAPDADAPSGAAVWTALMHPGQKLKPGARVVFERDGVTLHGEVLGRHFMGRRTIALWLESDPHGNVFAAIERIGHIPLPPYIARADTPADRERYQTVFAKTPGSIAAPTAGLHFTADLLKTLAAAGVETAEVTLHVGYGTFKPVRVERVEDHAVDPEPYTVTPSAADALTRARREGRRIIVVGTTATRVLETLAIDEDRRVVPASGETRAFIYPGHTFRLVDGLITNFHLPQSSLLMLVSALAGRERVLAAYREAVSQGYRFYSYGDAMLVL
jgi:S-adenosylmethionine:tRNA ribosyltransferase-isomerase